MSIATMLAYFEPIGDILTCIALLFVLNLVFGLLASLLAQRETFNFRKAFVCVSEASVYLLLLGSTFFIGDHLGLRNGDFRRMWFRWCMAGGFFFFSSKSRDNNSTHLYFLF